jgi:cytochrome c-type biogenesis protein
VTTGPIALALAAGMVGAFNPCGFSLLPAYVGFFVTGEQDRAGYRRVQRAVRAAIAMSAGFVVVFTVSGLVIESLSATFRAELPWITVIIGAVLIILGVRVLFGGSLRLPMTAIRLGGGSTSMMSMAGFGATYAVASLSCALGPFLAVTAVSMQQSTAAGLVSYLAYAAGMGLVIAVLGIGAALARPQDSRRLREFSRFAPRVGGALMVFGGAYAVWFGRWELAVYDGQLETDPLIEAVERLRITLVQFIESAGPFRLAIVILAGAAVLSGGLRRRSVDRTEPTPVTGRNR